MVERCSVSIARLFCRFVARLFNTELTWVKSSILWFSWRQRGIMIKAAFLGVSLLTSVLGYADNKDDLTVQISVKPSCVITAYQAMHWSFLVGTFPNNINNTTGSVTTLCTLRTSYTVGINNGLYFDALLRTRRMSDQKGHYVNYSIYSDSGYLIPWGNIGTSQALSLTGTGLHRTNTLYARIPAGQPSVPPGNYQDSLVVTLNF